MNLTELNATDLVLLISALRNDIIKHQEELSKRNAGDRDWDELTTKEHTLIKLQYQQVQLLNQLWLTHIYTLTGTHFGVV